MVFFWRKQCKIIPIIFPKPTKVIEGKECPICLKEMNHNIHLPCGHGFHSDCILDWIDRKRNCPICRFPLVWTLITMKK